MLKKVATKAVQIVVPPRLALYKHPKPFINICHSEHGSESLYEMLKRVQHDKEYSLALRERGRVRTKAAFTLAEVLITLAIIGVVAAITIPTLITNYQKKVTVTKLRKIYSELNNVVKLSEVDNGPMEQWQYPANYTNSFDSIAPFIKKYYLPYFRSAKLIKSTEIGSDYNIFTEYEQNMFNNYLILADGTILSFFANLPANYVWLLVDINGIKSPNQTGKDIFVFDIYKYPSQEDYANGIRGRYKVKFWYYYKNRTTLTDPNIQYSCNKNNTQLYKNFSCGRVIELDNWQIKDDYPW